MYSISNNFKTAIKSPIIKYKLRGTIGSVAFDEDDVLKNSLSITNQCSGNDDVAIGSVYVGELNMTLLMDINKYTVFGQEISLEVGVKLANSTYEYIPMGIFTVVEADRTGSGLVIKAYDNMSKLDKSFSEQITGTLYEMADFACTSCGVELANANFNTFVNHSHNFSLYPDSDIETFRDLLYWVAQTSGCYVTANRLGKIEFRDYNMTVVDTLNPSHRFKGGKFADYETWYTGISVVNMDEQTTSYYGLPQDDGLTYNLGSNPLLQYGNKQVYRENVLSAISSFVYVPFNVTLVGNPAYDLGDVLSFPDGLGDSSKKFCITNYTWIYNSSVAISGGGKNPKVLSVRSKTDKEITALAKNKSEKDVIQYYSFTNAAEITVGDGNTETIIDFRYTAVKRTVAVFLAEILCDVETTVDGINYNDGVGRFYYYLNSLYIDREPKETWQDGEHIKHILYYLVIEPGVLNHLEIKLKMTGGSATIPLGGIKACVYGQNLVASDTWNGFMDLSDNAIPFILPNYIFKNNLSDDVETE